MGKGTNKINLKVVAIVAVIVLTLLSLIGLFSKNAYKLGIGLSKEDKLALDYHEFTESDYNTQSENVRFLAFFERDLNKDGYSEKYDGTIRDMSKPDTLYLDINILSDGTLKNGKVTFSNDSNFKYKMAMQKDSVLSKNYISDNVKEIVFNDVTAGTRELINGNIVPNTSVDDYYSKVTQVRLTGIFVPSNPDLDEIAIDKTIDLTVDWYGNTSTNIETKSHSEDKEWFEETETVSDQNVTLSFSTEELLEQLIIKNASVTVTMPQLKGYYPEDIDAIGVERKSASEFVISRDAIVDDEGKITTAVARKNHFYVKMRYPVAAYKAMFEDWIAGGSSTETLIFNINASYTGLNNPKFEDAISYDTDTATVTVKIGADDDGVPYPETYFQVVIPGNELQRKGQAVQQDYQGRWRWAKQYGLDKGLLLDAWEGKNDGKFTYEVGYRAIYWDNGVRLSNMRIEMEPVQSDKVGSIDAGSYGEVYAIYSPMLPYLLKNGAEIDIYDATGYELTEEQNNNYSIDERINASGNRLLHHFSSADTDIINKYLYTTKENPYVITKDRNGVNPSFTTTGKITDLIIDIKNAPFKGDIYFYVIKNINCYPEGYSTQNPAGMQPVIDRDEITAANNVRSYAKGNYEWIGDDPRIEESQGEYEQRGMSEDNDIIDLINKTSIAYISILNNSFEPGEENTNKILTINAGKYYFEDATWKDGIFVVEVPESIINMEINDITASDGTIVKGWTIEKENGKYYLKILTSNEVEQDNIQITIDAAMVVDPRPGMAADKELKLYYENKAHRYYYEDKRISDDLDINDNENVTEMVGFAKNEISIASPSSIVTFQTVSEYDENGSITIAPNIADISKETRSAKMNLYLINGYSALVSDTKILGKVPYENNKFVLSDDYIGSTFSTSMVAGGITLPTSIANSAVVYYSEFDQPTKDTTLEANGWKLASDVTDWTKIKSFLIDCGEYALRTGESLVFTYNVTVPEGLEYNDVSYGTHAVFFNYHAENGILPMEIEPTKVGLKVARNYNLEGIKFKEGTIRTVAEATYKLSELNSLDEVEQEKSVISNNSGVFNFKHLYVNAEYTLQETDSPVNYLKNNNVIKFKVVENDDYSLRFVQLSENGFRDNPVITNINDEDLLQVEVEDAPKYQLNITYIDTAVNEAIPNTVFSIGEETYMTDGEGKISILRLLPNHQYSITEAKVDGCAAVNHTFNLTRTDDEYSFVKDEEMRLDSIVNDGTSDLIQVNITILKPGAARYNLEIVKVEKDDTLDDLTDMIKIPGAVFSLTSSDNSVYLDEIESDENAVTSVESLYQYSQESGTTGEYTLVEEKAPNGYILNQEEIKFVVKTINDELKVEISGRENLTSIKDVQTEGNTVRFIIQDDPFFRLTKKDSRTDEPLAGVKFAIYELNDDNSKKDFAKDINGNYIGEQNEEGIYEVITNDAGIIQLPIRDGKYVVEETKPLDGYIGGHVEAFEIKNGHEQSNTTIDDDETYVREYTYEPVTTVEPETTNTLEINKIEDLLDLSYAVAAGNTYSGTKVILMNDLDFTDPDSYRDSTSTAYGDVNGSATNESDGIQSILEELTTNQGFIPIGTEANPFSGVFDGNGKTISNLRISRPIDSGLFGYLTNAEVKDLSLDMNASTSYISAATDAGGISAYATGNTYIKNCTVTGSVSGAGNFFGGIVAYAKDNTVIENCTKNGYTGGSNSAGGIVGKATENAKIYNCFNTGAPSGGKNLGGIAAEIYDNVVIYNCHNTGVVGGANPAGIVTYAKGNVIISDCTNKVTGSNSMHGGIVKTVLGNAIIANCTSEASSSYSYLGGIASRAVGTIKFYNCHNKGTKSGSGAAGIVYECGGDIQMYNCTNSADSTISAGNGAGLVYHVDRNGIFGYTDTSEYVNIPRKLYIVGCTNEASGANRGGLVGWVELDKEVKIRIVDSENKGNVSGSVAAGIIGEFSNGQRNLDMVFKNVKNEGNISGSSMSGGIIGQFDIASSSGNVKFINVVNSGNVQGGSYLSGFMGYVQYGGKIEMEKCHNSGELRCSTHSGQFIGWLGHAELKMNECYNTGDVLGGGDEIGGFIGDNYTDYTLTIDNCYNLANVTVTGTKIGGLVGYSKINTITNSYNTGNIQGVSQVGGIIGQTWSSPNTISGCYNTGDITGIDATSGVGGIIGHIGTSPTTVENCYNKGKIEGKNIGGITGYDFGGKYKNCINYGKIISASGYYAGGISGYGGKGYEDCYNYGNISMINSGTSCSGYIGGIAAYPQFDYENVNLKNLYNKGNIFGTNIYTEGGVFGYLFNSNSYVNTLENTYNSGKVTNIVNNSSTGSHTAGIAGYLFNFNLKNAYNEGTISGKDEVAGIVSYAGSSNIESVYNIGDVISSNSSKIGPIIANYNEPTEYSAATTIDNAYYLDTAKLASANITDLGTSKNWGEMISTDFYNTLNRDHVWIKRTDRPPVLEFKVPVIGKVTEVNMLNDKEEYIIATQVEGDGGTISGQSEVIYETLSYGENSKKAILAAPSEGFVLTNLKVNGEQIDFTKDDEGKAELPIGFFRNMQEDKLVVASFMKEDKILTINKVDDTTNESLTGAKFAYSNYNNNWDEVKAELTAQAQAKIGELTPSATADMAFISNGSGGYVSTNAGMDNTLASSYIPIDLRDFGGKYNLIINAQTSSRSGDYGYLAIKETTDTPELLSSNTDGQLARLYGTSGYSSRYISDDGGYPPQLEGGKMYYLHMGYKKDSSRASGNDNFVINSVGLECADSNKIDDFFELDEEGKAELLYYYDKIYIKEIKAPDDYSVDSELHEYVIDDTRTITITNKHMPTVTAHYYLKENGEYTTKKVAEDEVYSGNIGEEYKVELKTLKDLEIEKDNNGEYVIPVNAYGTYAEGGAEINIYYESAPINLTIHHYIEGTETKLAEDEVIETPSQVMFRRGSNINYDVVVDESYDLAQNNNYKTLVESSYSLVSVDSNIADNLSIGDTLEYNRDAVLTYTYNDKDYTIKTKVQNHTETVENSETHQEEQIAVAGGTISGQELITYETVKAGEDATKDIVITADEGYIIKKVTVTSIDENNTETVTTIYGDGATGTAGTAYTGNEKQMTLSKFTNVQENKVVTAEFIRQEATVIVHHIKDNDTEDYATVTLDGYVGKDYRTEEISIHRYMLDFTSLNTSGNMTEETIHVYYYYKPDGIPIPTKVIVKYIDINSNETVTSSEINGNVDDTYTVTPEIPNGYVLMEENAQGESILPTNTTGPMTEETIEVKYYVAKEASVRAIYVKQGTTEKLDTDYTEEGYEGKTYRTSAKVIAKYDLVATPANAEGTMAVTDTSSETLVTYEYVKKNAKVVVKYIDINSNEVVTSSEINGKVDDTYTVTLSVPNGYVLMEENAGGESILPTNTTGPMTEETIEVKYYVAKEASVRAIYVKQGTTDKIDTDYTEEGYEGKAYRTSAKVVAKYDLVATPANAEGTMAVTDTSSETLVTYEYVKKNAKVVVKYIDINSNEVVTSSEINGKVDDTYTVTAEIPNGYVLMEENAGGESILPTNITGPMTEEIIEVKYYVAKEASVRAIYIEKGTTEKLDTDYTEEGYEGKAYRTSAKVVAKYDLVATPANAEGTMAVTDTSSETLVTYEYVKKNAKVVVKYIDINSNEVVTSSEINGKVDDTYTVTAEIPNGYVLMEENAGGENILPTNITGPMTEETIEVKYYVAKEASVRAIYVKQGTTEKLDTDYTEDGYEGKGYTTTAKEIDGYDLVATPANAEGTMAVTDTSSETLVTYEYVKKNAKVVVKYIDINSNEVVTSSEINGKVDDTYTVTPTVPNGYVLMEENAQGESILPTNTNGPMTLQPIEVKYYVAREASVRAIYVKQGTTEKLDTDYTEEGYEGKAYKTTAKTIANYELVATPANAEGTMSVTDTSSETLVTYEYVRKPAKVVVKYIDINSNEVVDTDEINGKVDDTYTVTPEIPNGYVLMEENAQGESILPTNTSNIMTLQPIEVKYYVAREASVRAIYVKQGTTEKLDTDYTEEGYEGKAYKTTAKTIANYELVATPANAEGTMSVTDTSSETLVTYEYKLIPQEPDEAKVIVKYVDVNSKEVVDTEEKNGFVGDPYEVNANVPDGYVLIEKNAQGESILPTNINGPMTKEPIEVKYYVAREASVRAIYVKQGTTEKLDADYTEEGYEGKAYTTTAKEINGYNLVATPLNAEGTMAVTDASSETLVTYEYKVPEPDDAKVIVKYIDVNTNEAVTSKEINGKVGDPYTVTPEVPEGYVLIEKNAEGESILPTNTSDVMTKEIVEVTYYVAREASVRAIYVVEGTETKVAEDVVIVGYEGKAYETSAKTISKYELVKEPANAKGKMIVTTNSSELVVKYEYKGEKPEEPQEAKVVVKYNDINSEKLVHTKKLIGKVGDPYEVTVAVPEGYVLVEQNAKGESLLPTNTKGTMKPETIEVTFYVAKDAKVTVSYIKEGTTTKLADDITIKGYEGKAYTTVEKEFDGYELSKVTGIQSGNMKSGNQEVIYNYIEEAKKVEKKEAKVKVIYIDTDTKKEIAESTMIEGYDGDPYTTSAKTIKDYEILVIPTNAKGTMKATEDGEEIVVKYIYKKNSAAKVVEKYVDINTQEVVESIDHEGKIGKSYEIKPNVPDGYKLQEKDSKGMNIMPIKTKGVMTEKPIEVVFYVAKDARVTGYYVVKYEDDELTERVVIEGYEGKEYAIDSKDIDGYELIEVDGKQEGLMDAGENIVTFYYAKKATGMIPQTGIHTLEYLVGTILVIFILNSGIRVVYKYKCRNTKKSEEEAEETEAKSEEKDNK